MVNGNAAISDHIQGILKDNKVVIFGTSHCAYAKKARQALIESGIEEGEIHFFDLEKEEECKKLTSHYQKVLTTITNTDAVNTTRPKVFIGGNFVGGGDETVKAAASGQIHSMAVKAGLKIRQKGKHEDNQKARASQGEARMSKHVEGHNVEAIHRTLHKNHNKSATHTSAHVTFSPKGGRRGSVGAR